MIRDWFRSRRFLVRTCAQRADLVWRQQALIDKLIEHKSRQFAQHEENLTTQRSAALNWQNRYDALMRERANDVERIEHFQGLYESTLQALNKLVQTIRSDGATAPPSRSSYGKIVSAFERDREDLREKVEEMEKRGQIKIDRNYQPSIGLPKTPAEVDALIAPDLGAQPANIIVEPKLRKPRKKKP